MGVKEDFSEEVTEKLSLRDEKREIYRHRDKMTERDQETKTLKREDRVTKR